jgi:hypothetical protein
VSSINYAGNLGHFDQNFHFISSSFSHQLMSLFQLELCFRMLEDYFVLKDL